MWQISGVSTLCCHRIVGWQGCERPQEIVKYKPPSKGLPKAGHTEVHPDKS